MTTEHDGTVLLWPGKDMTICQLKLFFFYHPGGKRSPLCQAHMISARIYRVKGGIFSELLKKKKSKRSIAGY